MGRNIPSITFRIESKIKEWERFAALLPLHERDAFRKLIAVVKDRRTAIDAADEDISIAMLLAIAIHLKGETDAQRRQDSDKGSQSRLDSP